MEAEQGGQPGGVSGVASAGIDPRPADLARDLAARGIELGPVIGRGAMSVVYRAFDAKHERSLAVKVLGVDPADPVAAARWSREISAVARLRHPNILPLIDSGTTPAGTHYFLMPLADGETLEARLKEGPLPLGEAVRYAREVAEALAFAHAGGLVHRDVKPANILLEGGHAVLADFGVVRPMQAPVARAPHQTGDGLVVGTPAYMSPEQLTGSANLDGRADLFSLGVVLYEAITGRLPFLSTIMPGLMAERLTSSFKPIATLRPGVPALLGQAIARALAPDPLERYDTAESMVADLQQVEHQLSGASPGATLPLMSDLPRYIMAVGLVLIGLVGVIAAWRHNRRVHLDPRRITVADFRNQTGDTALASIGPLASDMISAGLTSIPGLTVINSDLAFGAQRNEVDRRIAADGRDTGLRALVDSSRAPTVVSGSYYREGKILQVFAEVTDARSGRVLLDLGPLKGSPQRPDSVLALVRDTVARFVSALGPSLRAGGPAALPGGGPPR